MHFGWTPPATGKFKLNVDRACNKHGLSTAGGLIQDSNDLWMQGFQRLIESGTSFGGELWALRDGHQVAVDLCLANLEVEVDAGSVTEILISNVIIFTG